MKAIAVFDILLVLGTGGIFFRGLSCCWELGIGKALEKHKRGRLNQRRVKNPALRRVICLTNCKHTYSIENAYHGIKNTFQGGHENLWKWKQVFHLYKEQESLLH